MPTFFEANNINSASQKHLLTPDFQIVVISAECHFAALYMALVVFPVGFFSIKSAWVQSGWAGFDSLWFDNLNAPIHPYKISKSQKSLLSTNDGDSMLTKTFEYS